MLGVGVGENGSNETNETNETNGTNEVRGTTNKTPISLIGPIGHICPIIKIGTDARSKSRGCLHTMPCKKEEKPTKWD